MNKTQNPINENILDYFIREHNLEMVCDKISCQAVKTSSDIYQQQLLVDQL